MMRKISSFLLSALLFINTLVIGLVLPAPVFAAGSPSSTSGLFWNLSDCVDSQGVATLGCLGIIMHNIVVFLMIAAAFGTLFMLILAGIKFSLSGGDANRVGSARSAITYAIVGLAIVFLAFVILQVVAAVTGNQDIINGGNVKFVPPPQVSAQPAAT